MEQDKSTEEAVGTLKRPSKLGLLVFYHGNKK